MKQEHTAGPWTYKEQAGYIYTEGDAYNQGPMMVGQVRGWGHLTGTGSCHFDEKKAIEIQEANGRLMAAAPDLLKALKALRDEVARCITVGEGWKPLMDEADAAIEKAEPK